MNRYDWLTEIADRIADGTPIDWAALEARTVDTVEREMLTRLHALDRIVRPQLAAHLSTSPDGPGGESHPATPILVNWGPLKILGRVGGGSFGQVFRAYDSRLDRVVALKLLRRRADNAEAAGDAAIEEGRLLAKLRHPNIVTIYGAERIDGQVGIWMEFVEGRTLAEELRTRGPLPPKSVVSIGLDLCSALAAVHSAGLLHRDVKAQNIIRATDGRIVLADFGAGIEVPKQADRGAQLAGTPAYLAPEVLQGQPATPQSDLYSLAVLLRYLATGSFEDGGRPIPPWLSSILTVALNHNPRDRYQTARELHAALNKSRSGFHRHRRLALAAGAAGLTLAVMGLWRLSTLGSGGAGRNAPQLVCRNCVDPRFASLSHDGRLAVARLDANGDLATSTPPDPASVRLFTKLGAWRESNAYADLSTISRDTRFVAFRWFERSGAKAELRTIERKSNAKPVVLVGPSDAINDIHPEDWRPDGGAVLVTIWRSGNPSYWQLSWVPRAGGEVDVRATSTAFLNFRTPRVSPDGRFVVYTTAPGHGCDDAGAALSSRESHVCLVAATGEVKSPTTLVATAAENSESIWGFDGHSILFTSNIGGSYDLWRVRVDDGRVTESPEAVWRDIGRNTALALTPDGRYLYRKIPLPVDQVLVADIERRADGTLAVGPSRSFIGTNPSWSADGRLVAFMRRQPSGALALVVSSSDGQRERVYAHPELLGGLVALSHDGKFALVAGTLEDKSHAIYRVDLETRDFREVIHDEPAVAAIQPVAALSPDDRTLYLASPDPSAPYKWDGIVALELASGQRSLATRFPADTGTLTMSSLSIAVSPDGGRLALFVGPLGAKRLILVGVHGESPSDFIVIPHAVGPARVAWTADNMIWFTDRGRITVMPSAGGAPSTVSESNQSAAAFSVSPDGSRLAWRPVMIGFDSELWSLDVSARLKR